MFRCNFPNKDFPNLLLPYSLFVAAVMKETTGTNNVHGVLNVTINTKSMTQ